MGVIVVDDNYYSSQSRLLPPIPYTPGGSFNVTAYPLHWSQIRKDWPADLPPTDEAEQEFIRMHPIKRAVLHPPVPKEIREASVKSLIRLDILQDLQTGAGFDFQTVVATATHLSAVQSEHQLPAQQLFMAKFFDPVYWDHSPNLSVNPFIQANSECAREAQYYELLALLQGDLIPRFFGIYICKLAVPNRSDTYRYVLMSLAEHIPGTKINIATAETFESPNPLTPKLDQLERTKVARGLINIALMLKEYFNSIPAEPDYMVMRGRDEFVGNHEKSKVVLIDLNSIVVDSARGTPIERLLIRTSRLPKDNDELSELLPDVLCDWATGIRDILISPHE